MAEPDADFDALMAEMGELQDALDAVDGWDLDSQLSQAMDALQCLSLIHIFGRGGSDTTAVAVAWGINADVCEIYSDVEGVFTADPRVCPRAKKPVSYTHLTTIGAERSRTFAQGA